MEAPAVAPAEELVEEQIVLDEKKVEVRTVSGAEHNGHVSAEDYEKLMKALDGGTGRVEVVIKTKDESGKVIYAKKIAFRASAIESVETV